MHRIKFVFTSLVFALCTLAPARADIGALTPHSLRCEYLTNPLAIEEPHPRLYWLLDASRRAEHQSAYQVLVASTPDLLAQHRADLWDSGRVESRQIAHIEYAGKPLASRQPCHWKVRAWDRDGRAGPWSEPAVWEMGLLAPEDWTAQWIEAGPGPVDLTITRAVYSTEDGATSKDVTSHLAALLNNRGGDLAITNENLGGDPAYGKKKRLRIEYTHEGAAHTAEAAENQTVSLPTGRIPYLRRGFTVSKPIARARLYTTALGVHEITLNGHRIGDDHLSPGWTDYRKRVRYRAHDVTALLSRGPNALGAMVGPGWFSGRVGLFGISRFYGDSPALLAQLEVSYTDGSTERIITDSSWKVHAGPLLMADMMKGETYDARHEIPGWNAATFDDSEWATAQTRAESRNLQAEVAEPVRIIEELPAQTVTEPTPGAFIFDLEQNMVGVVRLTLRGRAGRPITIRHGEMLNPDGTLYTANLRGAPSIDTYTPASDAEFTWQPRFTFHGFRYVELTGLDSRPDLDAVTGLALSSDMPDAGTFECSDPRLNRLQSNIVWGLRGNYLSIPTDCPQRDERMGWMADTQVFVPTAAYNADIAAFMTKWMTDVIDAQREDGAHSDVAPVTRGLTYGTPAWADAGTIVPWLMYEIYADKRLLERCIDSMIKWVEWCRTHSTNLLRDRDRGNDYGDWLSISADTPKDVLGTAYFAHSADLVARSLRVLGRVEEAERYERLFEDIKAAFNAAYVAADGRIKGDTQTVYILGLRFNLLSDDHRKRAMEYLVADIESKGNRLSTGFVGVSHLLPVLSGNGKPDVAYKLLLQDEFPSWLYSVKHGATTIWERWNGYTPETGPHPDIGMNSFNHYALGSCGQWMFSDVAGIRESQDPRTRADWLIRPLYHGPLTSAGAEYRSIRGTVACRWSKSDSEFLLHLRVPPNTTALLRIPGGGIADVRESGVPVKNAEGVAVLLNDGGTSDLLVRSGEYAFRVDLLKPVRTPTTR
ncbi:MAG: family 78 glycoside hydrolase catalytic domain [Phycisphaeraceae bacterium]|nr:family 78 glycoside hydrolase catalytic domain [Phycisphaeraceae bacterium]